MAIEEERAKALTKEAKRIEEDCLHSGKGHLNSAGTWQFWHYALGIPTAACAAFSAFSSLPEELTGTLAIVAAVLAGVTTFLNPGNEQGNHRKAGDQFLALTKKVRRFREIDLPYEDGPEARQTIEELSVERDDLNASAPAIFRRAYVKAKSGIDAGESDYATDKESQ